VGRESVDVKIRNLTILVVLLPLLAAAPVFLLMFFLPKFVWAGVVGGLFLAGIGIFFVRDGIVKLADEMKGEIEQAELAHDQLSQMQKNLFRDIDTLSKNGTAIDAAKYSDEFGEVVQKINAIISSQANIDAAVVMSLKNLESGDLKISPVLGRTEIGAATDDLRKKIENIHREHQSALASAETAKKDAEIARIEVATARRETAIAREDATIARREASTANTDAANARREAAAAERRAERFRPAGVAGATKPMPARTTYSPLSPPAASARDDIRSTRRFSTPGATVPSLKSTKIVAPSGAHEYDRKDYGKY